MNLTLTRFSDFQCWRMTMTEKADEAGLNITAVSVRKKTDCCLAKCLWSVKVWKKDKRRISLSFGA